MNIQIYNLKNKNIISKFIKFTCNYLDIKPKNIEVDLLEIENIRGMCIDISDDSFLVLVKDYNNTLKTLAHELVHIKQYMKQNLGDYLGKEKYEDSWWEIEARSYSNIILEKFNECYDT